MQLVTNQRDLVRPLVALARSLPGRATMAHQAYLLVEATDGALTIAVNAGEHQARYRLPADVAAGGSIVVAARTMADAVGAFPDGELAMRTDAKGITLHLQGAGIKLQLRGMAAAEFLALDETPPERAVTAAADRLHAALGRCLAAVAPPKSSFMEAMEGVQFAAADGRAVLTATDTAILLRHHLPVEGEGGLATMVVAARFLETVRALLADTAGEVAVGNGPRDNLAIFRADHWEYRAVVIDAQLPEATQLIARAAAGPVRAVLPVAALRRALRPVGLVADVEDANNYVLLTADEAGQQLLLHASSPRGGEADVAVPAAVTGGHRNWVNNRSLAALLGALPDGTATLSFTPDAAVPIGFADDADPDLASLLMVRQRKEAKAGA